MIEKRSGRGARLGEQIAVGLAVAVGLLLLFNGGDAPQVTGLLAGAAVAVPIETRRVGFEARSGLVWQKIARLLPGVVVVFVLRAGLKAILPEAALSDFIRYVLIGLWAIGLAPWVFVTLRLASATPRPVLTTSLETAR